MSEEYHAAINCQQQKVLLHLWSIELCCSHCVIVAAAVIVSKLGNSSRAVLGKRLRYLVSYCATSLMHVVVHCSELRMQWPAVQQCFLIVSSEEKVCDDNSFAFTDFSLDIVEDCGLL